MEDEKNTQENIQTEEKKTEEKKEVKLNTYNIDEKTKQTTKNIENMESILGNEAKSLADKIEEAKNKIAETSTFFSDKNAELNTIKGDFTEMIAQSLDHAYDRRGKFNIDLFFQKFDELNKTVMPENIPLSDDIESHLIYDVDKKKK